MPSQDYNDLFTLTMKNRSGKLADNVSKNNALLKRLKSKDKIRTIDGGSKILEELEYGEGDMVWYSGYDTINYSPKQLFTAAEYAIKMAAVPVAVSGEDLLKNDGKSKVMSLMEKRIKNAEKTMANQLSAALYGDGTASNGKAIGGLKLLVADDPTTGTVGNINRATSGNEFWRNQAITSETLSAENIHKVMNEMYLKCTRGTDKPDLIITDDRLYSLFEQSLQPLMRYTDPKMAEAGFGALKFKGADVVSDGGQGGYCPEDHMYFLNTDYLYLRPHKNRNMKMIGGDRLNVNQDALYRIIGWAGNMTMSNASLQGVIVDNKQTSDAETSSAA